MINSYRDLKVWQVAMSLAEEVYKVSKQLPASETYGLMTQMRRAAVSIAANIAEGHGCETSGSFIQFLRMSQGSLKELETHAILTERLGYARDDSIEPILAQCDELGRMLRGLIRSLQEKERADD